MNASGLAPRWASSPGETIAAIVRERNLTVPDLARDLELSVTEVRQLLASHLPITVKLARSLSAAIGGSTEFWIAREAQYLDDLSTVAADRWSQGFPVKQMAEFGWIESPRDWHEQIKSCLDFFQVRDVEAWEERYGQQLEAAHFRTSPSFNMEPAATTAWFRACERSADRIEGVAEFRPREFEGMLLKIRELTRLRDPGQFVPALVTLCAKAGVRVVVVRAPKGCPVSGTARLYDGRPLIQLSARHLSDDHFWFTFFHEAAHVLLHDLDTPFVDLLEDETDDGFEDEANEFASDFLLGPLPPTPGPISRRKVIRMAQAAGVSPGVIVGQLQHAGRLPQSHLNGLKRRFVWRGANLEMRRRN